MSADKRTVCCGYMLASGERRLVLIIWIISISAYLARTGFETSLFAWLVQKRSPKCSAPMRHFADYRSSDQVDVCKQRWLTLAELAKDHSYTQHGNLRTSETFGILHSCILSSSEQTFSVVKVPRRHGSLPGSRQFAGDAGKTASLTS